MVPEKSLDRYRAVEARIVSLEHGSHAPLAQFFDDRIMSNRSADQIIHGGL
jgi:hypothetical protein